MVLKHVLIWALGVFALSCGETRPAPESPLGRGRSDSPGPSEKRRADAIVKAAASEGIKLDHVQRSRLVALASETACPCKGRGSLVDCLASCALAPFAARTVARGLRRGEPEGRIRSRLVERYGPREPEQIDVHDAPCRGPKNASVTLVIFSDFQCPYCGLARKLLAKIEQRATNKPRVCFKNFVIHASSRAAALAAAAADRQRKFWAYHELLFDNIRAQEPDDLDRYARQVGLDMAKFKSDQKDPQLETHLAADQKLALRLDLRSTPSFFVNGRPMTDPKTVLDFVDWIDEAVVRDGGPRVQSKRKQHDAPVIGRQR